MAGRREVPVDPGAGPVQRFAFELRKLRSETGGLTYRAMAQQTGYSITTLSQAAGGDRLPTLPVALAYVRACGGDGAEWEARWREVVEEEAARTVEGGGADGTDPPYRGLARFETGDSDRFFGRERLTGDLLDLVRRERFAAVFGPSGSGKSSLLRAGLIPALRQGQVTGARLAAIRVLSPGERPFSAHARLLTPADADGAADTLVVVDQFEEIFTLCQDPEERVRFIDLLLAARRADSRLRVLIAVRADFYGRCAEQRDLADALRDTTMLVGPMTPVELREAVVKPAVAHRLIVEQALTARLVDEVAGAPGGLPLLSHVLLETWLRRRGGRLTLEGYQAAGGLDGAIAKTAEDVYTRLGSQQAEVARAILLRLISPGDGTPDTRRPARRAELDTTRHPEETAVVVERLARARLLTLDGDNVELAHEAMINGWPRLRGWIEQDRERLRIHRKLTEAATAWAELGEDSGALYRGTRLTMAEERLAPEDLTAVERSFLTAGIAHRDREQHTAARTARRLRRLRTALSLAAVLALLVGVIAWQQNRSQERERVQAQARRIAALADSLRATDPVTAMRLSVASWNLADLPETRWALMAAAAQPEQDAFTDPDEDPAAVRYLSPDGRTLVSVGAKHVVKWDVRTHRRTGSFPGLGDNLVSAGVMSADASRLTLVREDGRVRTWDVRSGRVLRDRMPADDGAEISPSGRVLVLYRTWGPQKVVQLRDARTQRVLLERRMTRQLPELGDRQLFEVPDWTMRRLHQQRLVRAYPLPDAQVSPNDRLVALCLPGARLRIWDLARRQGLKTRWAPKATAGNCAQEDFQFTPDSRRLVFRSATGVRRWDIASGRELPEIRHKGLRELAFSADGRFMAATDDDEVLLWRTEASATPVFRYALSDEVVNELRLDLKERRIRYFAGRSQTVVRTLALDGVLDARWQNRSAVAASFSPDGRTLAIAHQETRTGRAHIQLRDGRGGNPLAAMPPTACPTLQEEPKDPVPCPVHLAFRPDGRLLAYGVSNPTHSLRQETVSLWDVPARRITGSLSVTRTDPEVPGAPGNPINGILFHPDRRSLVISRIPEDEALEFWDLDRKSKIREIAGIGGKVLAAEPGGRTMATSHGQFLDLRSGRVTRRTLTPGATTTLAYSPDGKYLAAGDESGQVTIWDTAARQALGALPATPARDGEPRNVTALAFSPDGRTLAAAGRDGTLRLWDTDSNRPLGSSLPTAGGAVLSLAFSPVGGVLYAAGEHVPLQKYVVAPRQVATAVCRRAGALSRADWKAHIPAVPYHRAC
ncbi:helix-turn-helix domain-containing protein [Streptomyces sp. NPDC059679]|uniref:nSTAND1 domain-containing NTPase n=1 Tax=Streptomyces sp. NPDC059679 TaxID=3346903 RepID=UPI00368E0AE5